MSKKCPNKIRVKHDSNPFIPQVLSVLKETIKERRQFVQGDKGVTAVITNYGTGEVIGESALMTFKKVDTEQFSKVYTEEMSKHFDMPGSAAAVFQYILVNLQKNHDQIYLYEDVIAKAFSLSEKSCARGINWLCLKNIIACSNKLHLYYINATVFFNGDRLTLITVYQKENTALDLQPLAENGGFLIQHEVKEPETKYGV